MNNQEADHFIFREALLVRFHCPFISLTYFKALAMFPFLTMHCWKLKTNF